MSSPEPAYEVRVIISSILRIRKLRLREQPAPGSIAAAWQHQGSSAGIWLRPERLPLAQAASWRPLPAHSSGPCVHSSSVVSTEVGDCGPEPCLYHRHPQTGQSSPLPCPYSLHQEPPEKISPPSPPPPLPALSGLITSPPGCNECL